MQTLNIVHRMSSLPRGWIKMKEQQKKRVETIYKIRISLACACASLSLSSSLSSTINVCLSTFNVLIPYQNLLYFFFSFLFFHNFLALGFSICVRKIHFFVNWMFILPFSSNFFSLGLVFFLCFNCCRFWIRMKCVLTNLLSTLFAFQAFYTAACACVCVPDLKES